MLYQWIGERQLHLAILQSLKLEENFQTDMFPAFKVAECAKDRLAEYNFPTNDVVFNVMYIQNKVSDFTFTYFHELAHSTSKHTNRWERMWSNAHPIQADDIVGLEEQVADIVAFIWKDIFDRHFDFSGSQHDKVNQLRKTLKGNKTKFEIPWKEVEDAVFCMLKNKTCPQAIMALKYYKKLISNFGLAPIKEGIFNG